MIRFGSEAASELEDAIDWYLSRSIRVAGRFHQTFSSVLSNFEADPDRFARIHLDFQFARILGFPFICIFRKKPDHIQILAIAHTSRRERYWIDRE
jgi:plasmid stabilization system protein ParE